MDFYQKKMVNRNRYLYDTFSYGKPDTRAKLCIYSSV